MKTRDKVLLTVLGIVVLVIYSSWGRPMWLDEYLHFAFGGFDSFADAWAAVQMSTTNINHGQTGFYMLLDFVLLKSFGANLFVMRLPSLISGALLLFSVALFLRRKNLGAVAIASAFLLLLAQPNLMYFVGEARPYMPMVASSMAALAYFSTSQADRSKFGIRLFGWGTMIWGALMMPYYVLYLPVIAVTTYLIARINRQQPKFLSFINLPMQITSGLIGAGLGALTWLRGSPHFQRDPWLIVRPLFDSITLPQALIFAVMAAIVLLTLWQGLQASNNRLHLEQQIKGAGLLILVMLGMAGLFALVSLTQSYWILPRQFVASQAIITVAAVWAIGSALAAIPRSKKLAHTAIFGVVILLLAGRATVSQVHNLMDWENNGFPMAGKPGEAIFSQINVGLANENAFTGGPVSSVFTEIYDSPRHAPGEEPLQ